MSRKPRSKEEFDQLPPLEQSRVKSKLVQEKFGAFCQHLTTADLPSFAPALHHSDLDELQKRARYESETVVISQLLLKLYRSSYPWWKTLEAVALDKGHHILYAHLNPWDDDDGNRMAAARGGQPSASHHASPLALPQTQPPPRRGGPQTLYPTSTPLRSTRGLTDPLKPLCEGQKWRKLADFLDLTMDEQLQIKAQVDDVHIHLIDAVVHKFGDNATVGTLTDALRQLGSEGEIILCTMEEKLLIQPVPREGSEAGEAATLGFLNPHESEWRGGTSTVTQQSPPYYPLPQVSSAERNLPPPLVTPRPVLSPRDFDPNMSNSSQDKVSVDKLVKGLQAAVAKEIRSNKQQSQSSSRFEPLAPSPTGSAELSKGLIGENASSNSLTENAVGTLSNVQPTSLTENDLVPLTSPGDTDNLQKELNTANESPADRVDTAYCSLDSYTGTSAMNIVPENIDQTFPDGQDPAHTGFHPRSAMHVHSGSREAASLDPALQVDSPVESLSSQQHPDQVEDPIVFTASGPGSSSESSPISSVSEQSLGENNGGRAGRNTNTASQAGTIIFNISSVGALNVGGKNKSTVKKTIMHLVQGLESEVRQFQNDMSGDESDVNTIAEYDAQSLTEESPFFTGSQYPGVAPTYALYHMPHQDPSAEPTAITPGGADHSPESYHPMPGDTAHQTSAKQLWTLQVGDQNEEHRNSLVEESEVSMDSSLYNVAPECVENMFRFDDPTLGGEGPVSQYPTHHSREADIDLRRLPVEELNITERESLASSETVPISVQHETEAVPAGERQQEQCAEVIHPHQQDQQLQQQPERTNFFLRLFSVVKEGFETLE